MDSPRPAHEGIPANWWRHLREFAVIHLDVEGRITDWAGDAESIFGYEAADAVGRDLALLFTPEGVEIGAPAKELAIALSGTPAEDDRWMRRRDGSEFWATGVLQAITDDAGQLTGFVKILRNRTDLKGQLEAQKSMMRRLRATDERKNRFITMLAHELRNPLASLSIAAEILRTSPDDLPSREFAVGAIERQVEFSSRLIEDLLDLTRIQRGQLRLVVSVVDLREILQAAVEQVRRLIDEKRQHLHLMFGAGPTLVAADADRLQQVFVNLYQNAAKYTPEGGDVWVKLLVEGKEAAVKIEDNGIGIATDVLPKIFDLFAQADSDVQHAGGGLGIGLAVVKDLVQLHGGIVQVRSDGLGRGSEFIVRLPLADADQQSAGVGFT